MNVQPVDNQRPTIGNILASSVVGGAVAAGAEKLLLPAEVKASLKNTRFGIDAYLKNAEKCANKTIKNGISVDVKQAVENAKKMYPEFLETAKVAKKSLAKTFLGVAGVIAGAKILSEVILNRKQDKTEQQ
ncbi:hypothetical protein IJD15_03205 [bacterium]|nr:hypothetical protein [bacterium]